MNQINYKITLRHHKIMSEKYDRLDDSLHYMPESTMTSLRIDLVQRKNKLLEKLTALPVAPLGEYAKKASDNAFLYKSELVRIVQVFKVISLYTAHLKTFQFDTSACE